MRTFIRWPGNKSKHIHKIIQYIPKDIKGDYIEPFVGSGAMFLYLQPKRFIINDFNKDLINVWKSVKSNPNDIISNFKEFGDVFHQLSNEDKKEYCKEKIHDIQLMEYNTKRASLYMLLKLCVHCGFLIVNNKFRFTSLDSYVKKNVYSFLKDTCFKNILNVSKYLNENEGYIYNTDYKDILKNAKEDDFIFIDPPYLEDTSYHFNYNVDENINKDFVKELKNELDKLTQKKVKWLMTYSNTIVVKELFKDYHINEYEVYRFNCKTKFKKELVIYNYTIS